ncbi:LysR family transcriptional regulator [Sphingomonas sp. BIUV-7]|uniref:LysR family transcriptional regulator n=1 Tax=Sphingomonas natans TaxID=3063330 RepID=A0ABT8YAC8_9SPHN|nr:LysR family transcriptional regulator [Sphingomonas sp. BIUV-7]MDO6415293.1 LysR family transcriptional regulator [Sphingomonas sp. BIUV-7]
MTNWDGIEEVVAVEAAGSFAGAAAALGLSSSHVSRAVARLEAQLQVQIFYRTTRRVVLTDDGRTLVEGLKRVIEDRDEAFARMSGAGDPRGEVRLTCSMALGERFVVPIVRSFAASHPGISVRIELTNRLVDLVGEGFDVAIRTGDLADSRLIATRLASRRLHVCAAPGYLARHSPPREIHDLKDHECLIGTNDVWTFSAKGKEITHRVKGRWRCNSGLSVMEAALDGMGICQLPDFYVRRAIKEGRLMLLLESFEAGNEPIWAVYPQHRQQLARVRLLVDRLKAHLQGALDAAE